MNHASDDAVFHESRSVETIRGDASLNSKTQWSLLASIADLGLLAVQMPARFRTDMQSLGNLPVPSRNGTVPLSSVASLALESGPNEIDRFDRRRYVTVTAALGTTPLGAALQAARALPAAMQLPPGVTLSDSGNAENMNDLISGFGLAMTASVLGIYCVLVLLFHDFIQPLTIRSALPLSLGGAFVALLATHAQLNIPSLTAW